MIWNIIEIGVEDIEVNSDIQTNKKRRVSVSRYPASIPSAVPLEPTA